MPIHFLLSLLTHYLETLSDNPYHHAWRCAPSHCRTLSDHNSFNFPVDLCIHAILNLHPYSNRTATPFFNPFPDTRSTVFPISIPCAFLCCVIALVIHTLSFIITNICHDSHDTLVY